MSHLAGVQLYQLIRAVSCQVDQVLQLVLCRYRMEGEGVRGDAAGHSRDDALLKWLTQKTDENCVHMYTPPAMTWLIAIPAVLLTPLHKATM